MSAWSDAAYAWMALGMAVAVVLGVWALILFGPDDDWRDDDEDAATIHWLEQALRLPALDESTIRLRAMTDETVGTCDWGNCDELTTCERWAADLNLWVGVCGEHMDASSPAPVDGDQLAFDREFDEITRAADWWGKK